jgi:hypothetical protein
MDVHKTGRFCFLSSVVGMSREHAAARNEVPRMYTSYALTYAALRTWRPHAAAWCVHVARRQGKHVFGRVKNRYVHTDTHARA